MPIFAAIAAITAVAGVASTVSGLSAQSASKKDIKEQNKAASIANIQVGAINEKVVAESKNQNALLRQDVKEKNKIISSTNDQLTDINGNLLSLNQETNEAIVGSNEERAAQVGLANDQAGVSSSRTRKQAIREAILLRGQTLNVAAATGAGLDSSGVKGGLGSLQSQLADTLGFATQDSNISREIFESSQREQELVNKAQQLEFDTSVENLKALEVQRKAENDLQLQQNASNLRISKSNNKINLLEKQAARLKEEAQLDPGKFIDKNANKLSVLRALINEATNKGTVARSEDGAYLTKLPSGGIMKTFDNGFIVKKRAGGTNITITPQGVKTLTKPDGTVEVSQVPVKRIQNTVNKIKALLPQVVESGAVVGRDNEPGGGGGF